MKVKTKKILAGCALFVTGVLALTGCSGVDISQEQVNKIMTVVENTDQFMKDTVDLLEKNSTSNELAQGYKILTWARANLYTDYDGYLDNVTISGYTTSGNKSAEDEMKIQIIKLGNGGHAKVTTSSSWGDNYQLTYAYEQTVTSETGSYTKLIHRTYDSCQFLDASPVKDSEAYGVESDNYKHVINDCNVIEVEWNYLNIKEEDLTSVTIMDNGNYVIKAVVLVESYEDAETQHYRYSVNEVTINADGRIVENTITEVYCEAYYGMIVPSSSPVIIKVKFEYGNVNVEDINTKIATANAYFDAQ